MYYTWSLHFCHLAQGGVWVRSIRVGVGRSVFLLRIDILSTFCIMGRCFSSLISFFKICCCIRLRNLLWNFSTKRFFFGNLHSYALTNRLKSENSSLLATKGQPTNKTSHCFLHPKSSSGGLWEGVWATPLPSAV